MDTKQARWLWADLAWEAEDHRSKLGLVALSHGVECVYREDDLIRAADFLIEFGKAIKGGI